MPTAGSPSCEGLIDGRARGHWRDRASFPAAGDGSALFIICIDLRRLIYTCISKTLLLGRRPSRGGKPRRVISATRYVDQQRVYPVTRPSTRGVRGAVMRKRRAPGSPKDSANSNIKRGPRPASNGSRSRCPPASCPTPAAFARPAPPCPRRPVKLGAVHHPPPTPGREEVPNCHPFLPAAVANWRPELAVDAVSRRTPPGARRPSAAASDALVEHAPEPGS